jgi:hypothetical protein
MYVWEQVTRLAPKQSSLQGVNGPTRSSRQFSSFFNSYVMCGVSGLSQ